MNYIETPRLILRDWKEEDLQPFIEMNQDENVMKYFPQTLSAEDTRLLFDRINRHFKDYGFGLYAVESKKKGEFIGFTGMQQIPFEADFTPGIEIGWRLKFDKWGKGYATEAASACLDYAKKRLGLHEIYAFTSRWNAISEHIMQKLEMTKIKEFNHPLLPEEHFLCRHVLYRKDL